MQEGLFQEQILCSPGEQGWAVGKPHRKPNTARVHDGDRSSRGASQQRGRLPTMPTSKGQIRQTLHWGSLSVPAKAHKEHILGCRVGIRTPTAGTWESLCGRTSQHSQSGRELAPTPVEGSRKAEQSAGGSTERGWSEALEQWRPPEWESGTEARRDEWGLVETG